jgi:hypothetical protein
MLCHTSWQEFLDICRNYPGVYGHWKKNNFFSHHEAVPSHFAKTKTKLSFAFAFAKYRP